MMVLNGYTVLVKRAGLVMRSTKFYTSVKTLSLNHRSYRIPQKEGCQCQYRNLNYRVLRLLILFEEPLAAALPRKWDRVGSRGGLLQLLSLRLSQVIRIKPQMTVSRQIQDHRQIRTSPSPSLTRRRQEVIKRQANRQTNRQIPGQANRQMIIPV